jgi:DNA-binding NarL/FixJ family response regulator
LVWCPSGSGIEATKVIHSEFPGIRIIGLSMYDDPETSTTMRVAGAVAFMLKSGHPDAPLAAIRGRARGGRCFLMELRITSNLRQLLRTGGTHYGRCGNAKKTRADVLYVETHLKTLQVGLEQYLREGFTRLTQQ